VVLFDELGSGTGTAGGAVDAIGYQEHVSVHGGHLGGGELVYEIDFTQPNAVAAAIKTPLPVPAGAIIETARFAVAVDPPGRSLIGDVAEVRTADPGAASDDQLVIDFMTMQTISEIEMSLGQPGLMVLHPWVGTEFSGAGTFSAADLGSRRMTFPEIQTERLLVDLAETATPDALAAGEVVLPAPPHSVEILINGVRAWFSPIGSGSPREHPPEVSGSHSFADVVDLTIPLQLALDADGAVEVELRASSPGQLQFAASPLRFFRTHDVVFSEGPTRTVAAPEEGIYEVDLPLPDEPGTEAWEVHALELGLRADIDATRIQPSAGPSLAEDVELVLAGSRTLLLKLPPSVLSRFGTITGLRIPVRVEAGGGELAGELLGDDTTTHPSRPGAEISDGAFTPTQLSASAAFEYRTMMLAAPYEPPPDTSEAAWANLRATRGEIAWALRRVATSDDVPPADLRWRAPSGVARPLSEFSAPDRPTEADIYAGAVRVVGTSDPNRPLDAVRVEIADRSVSVSLTPFETGSSVRIDLDDDPVSPSDQTSVPARALRIRLEVAGPGSYTIDSARLIYIDPALDAPIESGAGGTT